MNLENLRVLYPTLSDEELAVARENLDRYLLLAWEVYEDLKIAAQAAPLTVQSSDCTMSIKVDSHTP